VRHKFLCVVFGENEDRPGNSVKQTKKNKFRYERIVVKCLLSANLGNWTHIVLDLLWCQVLAICRRYFFILAFFVLLRTFLQFHAGIAGMTCDVSSNLGKISRRYCSNCDVASLGTFTQAVLDLLCCQSWPFLALIAGIVMLPSIWQFLAGIALVLTLAVLSISRRYRSNCAEHEHI
jgi:hypothetical protein